MRGKAIVKRRKITGLFLFGMLAGFFLLPSVVVRAENAPAVSKAAEPAPPKTELDKLRTEWEAVREQQVQMIRGKEDQLEKLKEEIFSKMKTQSGPVISGDKAELEAQKAALQADRQKFFSEMSRQRESLRQLQAALDEKAKQLEAEQTRFEQEKKMAAR
jgi:septal ring factor EnvC (AmiA/AmiB activator)